MPRNESANRVICDYCGESFKRIPCQVKEINFCCREHFSLYLKEQRVISNCSHCGQKISITASRWKDHEDFYCSRECFKSDRLIEKHKARGTWKVKEKEETDLVVLDPYRKINPCYYKEARAMLNGLNWRGKNRCTKLVGD